MSLDEIKKIGVVGAGTMGQGIAQICAMAGYHVVLYDVKDAAIQNGFEKIDGNIKKGIERGKVSKEQRDNTLSRIKTSTDIQDLKCDLVIEAIVEKLDVKRELFSTLEEINGSNTILASNTSSIPITRIASALKNPERFVGMHFFNPAHIMKLVEVISGAATNEMTSQIVYDLSLRLGKVPVKSE